MKHTKLYLVELFLLFAFTLDGLNAQTGTWCSGQQCYVADTNGYSFLDLGSGKTQSECYDLCRGNIVDFSLMNCCDWNSADGKCTQRIDTVAETTYQEHKTVYNVQTDTATNNGGGLWEYGSGFFRLMVTSSGSYCSDIDQEISSMGPVDSCTSSTEHFTKTTGTPSNIGNCGLREDGFFVPYGGNPCTSTTGSSLCSITSDGIVALTTADYTNVNYYCVDGDHPFPLAQDARGIGRLTINTVDAGASPCPCPDYTYQDPSGAVGDCISDTCTSTQKLKTDGTCEECADYTKPTSNGISCAADSCTSTQIVILDGTCQQCGDYLKADASGQVCAADTCASTEILIVDGTCQACPSYQKGDSTGKVCASDTCTSTQKLKTDGTCEECPDYQKPDSLGTSCASDVCTADQTLQIDGTCLDNDPALCSPTRQCREGYGKCTTDSSCEAGLTCVERQPINIKTCQNCTYDDWRKWTNANNTAILNSTLEMYEEYTCPVTPTQGSFGDQEGIWHSEKICNTAYYSNFYDEQVPPGPEAFSLNKCQEWAAGVTYVVKSWPSANEFGDDDSLCISCVDMSSSAQGFQYSLYYNDVNGVLGQGSKSSHPGISTDTTVSTPYGGSFPCFAQEFQYKMFHSSLFKSNENYAHIKYYNQTYAVTKKVRNVKDVFMSCKGETSGNMCVIMRLAANYPILFKDWFSYDPNEQAELPSIGNQSPQLPDQKGMKRYRQSYMSQTVDYVYSFFKKDDKVESLAFV